MQNRIFYMMNCVVKKVLKNLQNGDDTYCTDVQVSETK